MEKEIRIVVFDDNEKIRKSLELMFGGYENMKVVGSFENYEHSIERIAQSNANLVIMDIEIPPKNGIEAVLEIRKQYAEIPILMFTVFEDDEKIFDSICAGAQGYLLKNTTPEDLLLAINDLMNGGAPMTPSIARKILRKFSQEVQISTKPTEEYNLTKREMEILKLLTEANSYRQIADKLFISYETVRTHIGNIYAKLHVASKAEAVAKVLNEKLF